MSWRVLTTGTDDEAITRLLDRRALLFVGHDEVQEAVRSIVAAVRDRGDLALSAYA